jgi:hypothetical protein
MLIMSRAATPRPQPAGVVGVHTSCGEPSPLAEFRFDDDKMVWRREGLGGHVFRVERSPTSRCRTRAFLFAHIMSCMCLYVFVIVASSFRLIFPVFSPAIFPLSLAGRARCRRCGIAVGKGEIRIGFPMHDSRGEDGAVTGVLLTSVDLCLRICRLCFSCLLTCVLLPLLALTLACAGWNHLNCSRISAVEWPGMDPVWASGWYRRFAPIFLTILIHSLAPYENDENRRMIENIGYVKVSCVSVSLHCLTCDDIFLVLQGGSERKRAGAGLRRTWAAGRAG